MKQGNKNRKKADVLIMTDPFHDGQEIDQGLQNLSQAVLMRDCRLVKELTERMLVGEVDFFRILNQGLIPGMLAASERFRRGECYIPELLMSSRALTIGLNIIRPLIQESKKSILGRVVIGTVKFDPHDIGKDPISGKF